ncbi:Meiosis-specific protein PAIR3 [Linum grandiflorum]
MVTEMKEDERLDYRGEKFEEFIGCIRIVSRQVRERLQSLELRIREYMVDMRTTATWKGKEELVAVVLASYGYDEHEREMEGSGGDKKKGRPMNVSSMSGEDFQDYIEEVNYGIMSKSSKIMMTLLEEIHQHLQNVELEIKEDKSRVTIINSSKRKRKETSIEQAEKLKTKYEELKRCIRDHESTLDHEGLEAHKNHDMLKQCYNKLLESANVLRGIIDEQNAAPHHKVMVRVEETVEKLVADAERKIEAVLKEANGDVVELVLEGKKLSMWDFLLRPKSNLK